MAELKVYKEPDDSRNAGADGISCIMSIIDHEGRQFEVDISLHQEGSEFPLFSFNVTRTNTSQDTASKESIYTRDIDLPFEGVVTHEMVEMT